MISFHEATKLRARLGNIIDCYLSWRGKNYCIKMFFPSIKKPSRREVQDQVVKVYPEQHSGITKFPIMTKENPSSKSEVENKELKKKVEQLEKIIDMTIKTREHDKKFGKYEMM